MEKFEILLYSVPEEKAKIEVFFEDETFWLSQKKMGGLMPNAASIMTQRLR